MANNLKLYVGSVSEAVVYPSFFLSRSNWDDYNFKTTFNLYRLTSDNHKFLIGEVKVGYIGQEKGRTQLPAEFNHLSELEVSYFSLGQSKKYYERLRECGQREANFILSALNDVTQDIQLLHRVKHEKVFVHSMTRFLGSLDIANLRQDESSLVIKFSCKLHSSRYSTDSDFNFEFENDIPGSINALIGKNGAGKSQLLANFVASVLGLGDKRPTIVGRESIKKVIVVSYSIFDRFFLPDQIKIPESKNRKEYLSDKLRYVYLGLREKVSEKSTTIRIASSATFSRRFTAAVKRISEEGRYDDWKSIVHPILNEAGFDEDDLLNEDRTRKKFTQLGAGHKSTLSILTSLYAEIVPGSLIVIDEPENHLHPLLLSATINVLMQMLKDNQSIGVISTHSPFVIQELPAKYVRVLRKIEGQARVDALNIESFGTSIDSLINDVFGLPAGMPNFATVLKNLAERNITLETLEDEIEGRLSSEARSYYLSLI